ncbi:PAC2 family protein [Desertihabitans aurantiacus]|uniref:PAC2 family protein n=1 Tax=Desertihabitans aurantiacus TaxID=2282477 RepID=UPI000DF72B6F|nr:PAC2 family protein [Desertihabitans aurantiacus]
MSEQHLIPLRELRRPLVVMAFTGWNDAGNAASQAVEHLGDQFDAELAFELDPDDYYDFQVNRPQVSRPEPTETEITWPTTSVEVARLDDRDLVLVSGPEPNMRWRQYARTLVSMMRSWDDPQVIVLGALLADTPHTRPIPVSGSTTTVTQAEELGLELSTYEGPTGITGVITAACADAGIKVVSLWAAVPHYVSHAPSPKATLALLNRVEDFLGQSLQLGDLPELSRAWERGVDELASEDSEVAEYIATLERQQDETELPDATGDAIAAEFQRYLRRRGQ